VHEDKENLVVSLEVPGMKKEDFEIALHEGVLSISGERRFEEKRQKAAGYRSERFEGRFQRSVRLPKAVDASKVRAAYKDGILTVHLPIAAEARPRQIVVGAE
jgi:HSP20 family protein